MIDKREELAELIIKNLIFIPLFVLFGFYGITLILLPKIQDFQDKRSAVKQQQFFELKLKEQNHQLQTQIDELSRNNQNPLASLQKNLDVTKLQTIAQEYFNAPTIKEIQNKTDKIFSQTHLQIEGESNGIKAIFDFIEKIDQLMPNASFALPLLIQKEDPLTNTLRFQLLLHTTKLTPRS
ncbi:hypothetical protein [Helicobacter pametensis]|uniref:hypothetical protein n=1 Tax=Helicobacter pametensis TaxID=95149 RepID=UPI000486B3B0|nr:hypothetical protein [Helicobacter pametensis]